MQTEDRERANFDAVVKLLENPERYGLTVEEWNDLPARTRMAYVADACIEHMQRSFR